MRNVRRIEYLAFNADWDLASRPRRIALLIDDAQEEYREYAEKILPNIQRLVKAFREHDEEIVWSVYSRQYHDGIRNAMDRWYGPRGITSEENAVYIWHQDGMEVLKEVSPTPAERAKGNPIKSQHLDMFWNFDDESGRSILDHRLKAKGIDTIVIAGLWTDECVISTAYAGLSRGYDVVIPSDAVATATPYHEKALTVMGATCCKVYNTEDIVEYLNHAHKVSLHVASTRTHIYLSPPRTCEIRVT